MGCNDRTLHRHCNQIAGQQASSLYIKICQIKRLHTVVLHVSTGGQCVYIVVSGGTFYLQESVCFHFVRFSKVFTVTQKSNVIIQKYFCIFSWFSDALSWWSRYITLLICFNMYNLRHCKSSLYKSKKDVNVTRLWMKCFCIIDIPGYICGSYWTIMLN